MALDFAMTTNVGKREINEDSAACIEYAGGFCFVVADGLGGHGYGEVASRRLTDVFTRVFTEALDGESGEILLSRAFNIAQEEILELQRLRNTPNDLKTTAVALSVSGDTLQWAHCGDSRLYIFRKNKFRLRTLDHSVPQYLAIAKEIKDKDIAHHQDRNKLLRVVGVNWDSPQYTLSEPTELEAGHAFLLCTDGFWEYIETKKLEKFLKKSGSASEWLELITKEVETNAEGTNMDNYTAIAVISE
ncbi:MAG: protein phosphatase 2C domain-containing protein [Oscillospiraceae bacterium]|jgi:serine/threonine protein phosphatase PrpC|nr:protein phosphatase 2C domain-containing protein [Oscillospiraceae bacterium]